MKIDAVPGIDVSVRSNGITLHEYEDEADSSEDNRKGVKYIEATSGSNFSVYFQSDHFAGGNWPHIACDIILDGRLMYNPVLEVGDSPHYIEDMVGSYGQLNGRYMLQRFKFAELSTDDGPIDGAKISDFKSLGEIEINLYACLTLSIKAGGDSIASAAEDTIPEKCLKGRAISNRASLGNPEPVAGLQETCTVRYKDRNKPFATFVFKYRSRKDLQIEGLIPRSPSPVPLEDRDPDDLSNEEARELLRRIHAQKNEKKAKAKVKVKKEKRGQDLENDDDVDEDGVTISEERSTKRPRLSPDSGVEVVDLTDD